MDSNYNLFRRTTPRLDTRAHRQCHCGAMLVLNGPPIVQMRPAWSVRDAGSACRAYCAGLGRRLSGFLRLSGTSLALQTATSWRKTKATPCVYVHLGQR